jgi:dipeptidyl aminopeptidase/acylaminoacyl peptidase
MSLRVSPYGEWDSPISAADTISDSVTFSELTIDRGDLYWVEGRPSEKGRQVLVRLRPGGEPEDLTPEPFSVRTRVHEYGGGALLVTDGVIYFSNDSDQRLYRLEEEGSPVPVTEEPEQPGSVRYADGRSLPDGRLIYVKETHRDGVEPRNELVIIEADTGEESVFATGADFYSSPRPSPDGALVAWVEWDHPNMPWDGTRLMVGGLNTGARRVCGGDQEAVMQPAWSPDGFLHFITDPAGWWNVHRWDGSVTQPVIEARAECGIPQWVFGRSSYAFVGDGRIAVVYHDDGVQRLGVIEDGVLAPTGLDFTSHNSLSASETGRVYFVGGRADGWLGLVSYDIDTGSLAEVKANPMAVPDGFRTVPERITFRTVGGVAHGIYYPPANPQFEAPAGEAPPLIVKIHGGPTSMVVPHLDPRFAFWTSRGFGIVDVNYRGSTGYGREYREKLRGNWGVSDVEDAAAAARYLVDRGKADPDRVAISGGSAGGFTVLAALTTTDVFKAGASYYGIADLRLLKEDSHKFESRYEEGLVGSEESDLIDRSPITNIDRLATPLIVFQGLKDRVVPPSQARVIVDALAAKGVTHAYVTYENEDHGFRDAANIANSLESELSFYGEVFGFAPVGDIARPEILGKV